MYPQENSSKNVLLGALYMIQIVLANRWPISAVLGEEQVTERDQRFQ